VAASSPYAVVAYLATVVSWVVVVFRVSRNKNLLAKIEAVPAKERARVLQAEMGEPVPPDLTPEQWLRAKRHKYWFIGGIVLVLCLTLVSALAVSVVWFDKGSLDADIAGTPNFPPSERPGLHGMLGTLSGLPDKTYRVSESTFSTRSEEGVLVVRAENPYYDLLRHGGDLGDLLSVEPAFPELSVLLSNNTDKARFVTAVRVHVRASEIDPTPIPYVEGYQMAIGVRNQGYGPLQDVVIEFRVGSRYSNVLPREIPATLRKWQSRQLGTVSESSGVVIEGEWSEQLDRFATEHQLQDVPFEVRIAYKNRDSETVTGRAFIWVPISISPGAPSHPTAYYPIVLDAGREGYTVESALSHVLAPGETDHLALEVVSDKSARFLLTVEVFDSNENLVGSRECDIEVISPRGALANIRRAGT
jgi:hypothetical protein